MLLQKGLPYYLCVCLCRTVDTASLEFEEVPEALQPLLQLRPRTLLDNRGQT